MFRPLSSPCVHTNSSQRLNLDNSFSLEKRVREEQRKKLSLRDEIRRARAERQEVALRMDEIRIRHETESKHAQVCIPITYFLLAWTDMK